MRVKKTLKLLIFSILVIIGVVMAVIAFNNGEGIGIFNYITLFAAPPAMLFSMAEMPKQ